MVYRLAYRIDYRYKVDYRIDYRHVLLAKIGAIQLPQNDNLKLDNQ